MRRLLPLFLVSAATVGLETALTRYFAVSKWSEYGYWVISIVLAGFALSGVAMAAVRPWAMRHGDRLLRWLPPVLILAAAAGYWGVVANPFNPLQLQNAATYEPQLWNIAGYYAALLPFFFLTGFFISLVFVMDETRVGRVYGFDLVGAGAGSLLVLGLMYVLHPFALAGAMLVVLALACWAGGRLWPGLAGTVALAAGLSGLWFGAAADYNDYKAIYAPLHVPDAQQVAEIRTPRGLYVVLQDFMERLDTDVSNDAGLLNVPGPPQTLGLYRDGSRIAALPSATRADVGFAPAALSALPYVLRPGARVLLAGASGGFGPAQSLALGASHVDVLEPDPVVRSAVRDGLGPAPALPADPRVDLLADLPISAVRHRGPFDLIDIAGDFLDAAEVNGSAFTVESLSADLRALAPGGLVSVPVSIREFPVYALRVLATVREALRAAGVADPANNVVLYRSAWNVRILLSPTPWTPDALAAIKAWCDARSFDVSYFPGIDLAAAQRDVFNDLPAVSFDSGEVVSGDGAQDAVADEAGAVLRGESTPSDAAFSLRPITLDQPAFYSVLRLSRLPTVLQRLEILPQPEVGQLINVAVLIQAAVLALVVLLVPLFLRRVAGERAAALALPRAAVYFASLGLGFLFIELYLIEKASLLLGDRTSAFALVLTGMLVFSGLGSFLAERVSGRALGAASLLIVGWCAAMLAGGEAGLLAVLTLPLPLRAILVVAAVAPVSVALGLPFPLGLRRMAAAGGSMLPWAWALNGAFSVVATPLANLLAVQAGFSRLLLAAAVLYTVVFVVSPSSRKIPSWQPSPQSP